MTKPTTLPDIADYPARVTVPLRYNDTDRQGHVNNAVFVTLLETGRVRLLYSGDKGLSPPGTQFVIANLNLDYVAELDWRYPTEVGSGIAKIGTSSIQFSQMIVQEGKVAEDHAFIAAITHLTGDGDRLLVMRQRFCDPALLCAQGAKVAEGDTFELAIAHLTGDGECLLVMRQRFRHLANAPQQYTAFP